MPELDETPPPYGENGWHTLASARYAWADAPYDDFILEDLLEVSKMQCLAFAPALAEDTITVPVNFRVAQLMQARNLWNASKTDPASGGYGDEGFVIRPFPMDWTVKNILRPKRGAFNVG